MEKYVRDAAAFAAYMRDRAITKETVIGYKKNLQGRCAVRSVNSMLASLNGLFAFLGWHDLKVKMLKLQQQVYCPEEKELTRQEYTRLIRAAERRHNRRLCLILQTICGTGIRVSELRYITVEAVRRGEAVVNCKAKTRAVFIVKALKQKLLRYAAEQGIESGMIFVTRTGKPVNRTKVSNQFIFQPCAFIHDKSFHSYNLLFLSATIVAEELAEIECADSKKAPSRNHFQDGAFLLWIRANTSRRNRR